MRAEEFPDHVVEDIPLLGKQIGPERGKLPTELEEPCSTQNIVTPPPTELEEPCSTQNIVPPPPTELEEPCSTQNIVLPTTCRIGENLAARAGHAHQIFHFTTSEHATTC